MKNIVVLLIFFFVFCSYNYANYAQAEWEVLSYIDGGHFNDIFFFDDQHGWAVGGGFEEVIFHTQDGGQTWQIQHRKRLSIREWSRLEAVHFVSLKEGWVVGTEGSGTGIILHTEDGGRTWRQEGLPNDLKNLRPVVVDFRDVYFVTPNSGWIVGDYHKDGGRHPLILHTEDGGKNWQLQNSPRKGTYPELGSVFFISPDEGWAVGNYGLIIHTQDGGKNWSIQPISGYKSHFYSVYFISPTKGWAVGLMGVAFHTEDGGQTWHIQLDYGEGAFESVFFLTENKGWIVGNIQGIYYGFILQTEDGGKNWQRKDIENIAFAVYFSNPQNGWVAGFDNLLLKSEDEGKTWKHPVPPMYLYKAASFMPSKEDGKEWEGWILARGDTDSWTSMSTTKVLHSIDMQNWEVQSQPELDASRDLFFIDSSHGWLSGAKLFFSEDSGKTWGEGKLEDGPQEMALQKLSFWLQKIFFWDEKLGWAVGFGYELPPVIPIVQPIILHTQDGGKSWKRQSFIKEGMGLLNIQFVSKTIGWAVGYRGFQGIIVHTEDGGGNWKIQAEVKVQLRGCYFISQKEGWVVGDNGTVFHTKDGGDTWEEQRSGDSDRLIDVWFADSREGWAVGTRGLIVYTQDGGKRWEKQKIGVKSNLHTINYAGGGILIVTGQQSTILSLYDKRLEQKLSVDAREKLATTWGKLKSQVFQNYPNPFNPETWIPYQLAESRDVVIKIFDISGRLVSTLNLGRKEAGSYISKDKAAYWDGKNEQGEQISSGIYFYTFEGERFQQSRKMILIK